MPLMAYFAIVLTIALIFFGAGWESAVHIHRSARHKLAQSVADLEKEVDDLNARLQEEPLRTAMSHGQLYIINQISALVSRLRDAIPE